MALRMCMLHAKEVVFLFECTSKQTLNSAEKRQSSIGVYSRRQQRGPPPPLLFKQDRVNKPSLNPLLLLVKLSLAINSCSRQHSWRDKDVGPPKFVAEEVFGAPGAPGAPCIRWGPSFCIHFCCHCLLSSSTQLLQV